MTAYDQLDAWIDAHFDEEVRFLQALVQVPTDTPPGNNAPHAERTAELLTAFGFEAEKHPVPAEAVQAAGLESHHQPDRAAPLRRRRHDDRAQRPRRRGAARRRLDARPLRRRGRTTASSTAAPRRSARATSRPTPSPCARSSRWARRSRAASSCTSPTTRSSAANSAPAGCWSKGLTKPDLLIAAGFSYQVVTAHNGCLQMEVTVHGKMAHAAIPDTGVDALQGAIAHPQRAVRAEHAATSRSRRRSQGITHPYLNVGRIEGGTNTNVVPGKVVLKLDRRMIPEERPGRGGGDDPPRDRRGGRAACPASRVEIKRLLLARALTAAAGQPAAGRGARRSTARRCSASRSPTSGTPLYTDVRLYCERGIPAVIYGAGPRTVLETQRQARRRAPRAGGPAPRHQGGGAHAATTCCA